MASIINASTSGVGGVITTADNSGDLNIQSGGSTKIAVTSAGVAVTGLSKGSLPTGSVLQVVSANYSTSVSTTSTSFVTAGLSASITPTSATSKIMIIVNIGLYNNGTSGNSMGATVFRGTVAGTNLGEATWGFGLVGSAITGTLGSITYLDSPATTSATSYTVGIRTQNAANLVYAQYQNTSSNITLMEIAA
jgi:hypothetical protein